MGNIRSPQTFPGASPRIPSELLLRQGRRKGLLELLRLIHVLHHQRVQELAAPNLELRLRGILLDLDGTRVLAAGDLEELANLRDLLRHDEEIFLPLSCAREGEGESSAGKGG